MQPAKGAGQQAGRKGCGWVFGTANFKPSFGTRAERARRRERERAQASMDEPICTMLEHGFYVRA
jgi:hypothetical protein